MINKIVFFDLVLSGHHLEYLHHLSENINCFDESDEIVFIVNNDFEFIYSRTFGEKINDRIKVVEISKSECQLLKCNSRIKYYLKTFQLLNKYLKSNRNVTSCFLMDIYPFMLGLSLFKLNTNFSGIYFIPIAKSKDIHSKIKIFLLRRSLYINKWKKIFVLNNSAAVRELKELYIRDDLFESICDPINSFSNSKSQEESRLHNFNGKISFLHIGSISERKGVLEILDAIDILNETVLKKVEFIIAGVTSANLLSVIKQKIDNLNLKVDVSIAFYNKKLSNTEFDELFQACDYVLVPYKMHMMSSGIIGHAINYNKPVIGSNKGLIKDIIIDNKAGIIVEPTKDGIAHGILSIVSNPYKIDQEKRLIFIEKNSPIRFVEQISYSLK